MIGSMRALQLLFLGLLLADGSRGEADPYLLEQLIQMEGILDVKEPALEPHNPTNYDFIVVGGGTSGCTLASRLSENPRWTVALIEAGGVENVGHLTPLLSSYTQLTPSNWGFKSVPQNVSCLGMINRQCALPRGKVLGGSSSINTMIYNRGNRRDFDGWAAAGNPGWSYREVLPYFLRSENAHLKGLEHSPYHNHSGPLSVEYVRFRTKLVDAFVEAAVESGLPLTDYNGESQIGVSYVQATTLNGRRHSAYSAYLQPQRDLRPNLHIFTFSRVTRLLVDEASKSAYGVEFDYRNQSYTFKARKEVILSAGVFGSPQILILAGIGPEEDLKALGIPLVQALPVGRRMYDHISHFGPTFVTNTSRQTNYISRVTTTDLLSFFYDAKADTRLSSIGGVEALAFLKSNRSQLPPDWPDIEFMMAPGSLASDEGTSLKMAANFRDEIYEKLFKDLAEAEQDHFTLLVMLFHPKSVGRLWLKDQSPFSAPQLDPQYYMEDADVEVVLDGIKAALRISEMPALQKIGTKLLNKTVPGCEGFAFASDDYWRCSIRTLSFTIYHQTSTCRMGPQSDPHAVVDHRLKVHGLRRLRVVDASIIPVIPAAHTNAVAYMIAEKAADMIRSEWGQ
nr:glucose dehydrogenase [FAD, quinone]-like [Drosophila bipectinata]